MPRRESISLVIGMVFSLIFMMVNLMIQAAIWSIRLLFWTLNLTVGMISSLVALARS